MCLENVNFCSYLSPFHAIVLTLCYNVSTFCWKDIHYFCEAGEGG